MNNFLVASLFVMSALSGWTESSFADSSIIDIAITSETAFLSSTEGDFVTPFGGKGTGVSDFEAFSLEELYIAEEQSREPVNYCTRYPDDCQDGIEEEVDETDESELLEGDLTLNRTKFAPLKHKIRKDEKVLEQYSEGDCLKDTRSWLSLKDRYNEFTEQALEDVKRKYGLSNTDKCRTIFHGELEFERKEIRGQDYLCIKYVKSEDDSPLLSVICRD